MSGRRRRKTDTFWEESKLTLKAWSHSSFSHGHAINIRTPSRWESVKDRTNFTFVRINKLFDSPLNPFVFVSKILAYVQYYLTRVKITERECRQSKIRTGIHSALGLSTWSERAEEGDRVWL